MPKPHSWEQDATALAQWLATEPKLLAAQLMENGRAPFAQSLTEAEKTAYYDRQTYNLDGTPNLEGRTALVDRIGLPGYTQVMQAVNKMRAGTIDQAPPLSAWSPTPGPASDAGMASAAPAAGDTSAQPGPLPPPPYGMGTV